MGKSKTEIITEYLIETYKPEAIITYGSFGDGSFNENSDFDALVIADHAKYHDVSVVDNTVLDVFVYPVETFEADYDPEEFMQIFDGNVVLDKNGIGEGLKKRINDYIDSLASKSDEEIRQELDWCEKMLARTVREDEEGFFRWHWLLVDSIEIYCDIKGIRYFGPKKTLRKMKNDDRGAFAIYSKALKELNKDSLREWISYLNDIKR
ncbi:MAG: nucleotidyltransferase domain-containing protein [Lachnospiraceae bacterium]|nr:nucleotidyltransferase domain-containing protein [Lachnospiraceae bacterium]